MRVKLGCSWVSLTTASMMKKLVTWTKWHPDKDPEKHQPNSATNASQWPMLVNQTSYPNFRTLSLWPSTQNQLPYVSADFIDGDGQLHNLHFVHFDNQIDAPPSCTRHSFSTFVILIAAPKAHSYVLVPANPIQDFLSLLSFSPLDLSHLLCTAEATPNLKLWRTIITHCKEMFHHLPIPDPLHSPGPLTKSHRFCLISITPTRL
jgi:hypothetical protein